jgi:hypothetical protein
MGHQEELRELLPAVVVSALSCAGTVFLLVFLGMQKRISGHAVVAVAGSVVVKVPAAIGLTVLS